MDSLRLTGEIMNSTFPTYQAEETARNWGCFNCCKRLSEPMEQYDYKIGQYAIKCLDCQMYTWFDLKEVNYA
jgi:hypothetical protein